MSDDPASNDERPCLHCAIADTIDDFYAEYGSLSGEKDTIDMDEIISALGKTVAELTFGSDAYMRHCCRRRRGRACWSYAVNLPTVCSPIAISVRGTAASTVSPAPNSAPASSHPRRGSARISITPVRNCSIAGRKVQAQSFLPHAT